MRERKLFLVYWKDFFLNFTLDNGAGRIRYTEGRIDNSLIFNDLRWSGARIASALKVNELQLRILLVLV
jgi:hypothetical protein